MQPADLVNLVSGGVGAITVLAFVVMAFIRGTIVPKPQYDDLARDRDYWRSIADRALTAAEKFAPPISTDASGGRR